MKDSQKEKQEKITLESLFALMYENEKKNDREAQKRAEEWQKSSDELKKSLNEVAKAAREANETAAKANETAAKANETAAKASETAAKASEIVAKTSETVGKMSEKADETLAKASEIVAKTSETVDKMSEKVDKILKSLGGMGNSNGEIAEEYFQSAFEKNPALNGETYDKVVPNIRWVEHDDEYDLLLLNDKSVAIIEVKYRAQADDIGNLLKKGENFRKFLPQYNNRKLYLGLASLSFRKVTEKKIMEKGIAVIKQVGDKMVVYDKNLKTF